MRGTASNVVVRPRRFGRHFVVLSRRSNRGHALQPPVLNSLTSDDAVVPEIWAFEIANSIFVSYSKRQRISERQVREYLDLLKALPIRLETQSLWANVDLEALCRRQNIAAYDAAYLELAERTSLPLATVDVPLKRAALAQGILLLE